ncbi:MAG: hypothetical protein ACKVK8_04570 [Rhodospirillales bacterium]|jgi:hypothetical protein
MATAAARLQRVEEAVQHERGNGSLYFNDDKLSMVDASYEPFLNRFTAFDAQVKTGLLYNFPLILAWRDALLGNEIVTGSLAEDFLLKFSKLMIL